MRNAKQDYDYLADAGNMSIIILPDIRRQSEPVHR